MGNCSGAASSRTRDEFTPASVFTSRDQTAKSKKDVKKLSSTIDTSDQGLYKEWISQESGELGTNLPEIANSTIFNSEGTLTSFDHSGKEVKFPSSPHFGSPQNGNKVRFQKKVKKRAHTQREKSNKSITLDESLHLKRKTGMFMAPSIALNLEKNYEE